MTTKWAGWIVAALALAALAAGAVYAASHSTEVRITARQLEDGRVEFALQQRVDGEWGERQLPRSRFFPANVGHNRWLNSTPLTVSVEVEKTAVRFSDLNWDSALLQNRIAAFIVEHGYGYPVELVPGDTVQLWEALTNGNSDITMEMWPAQQEWYKNLEDQSIVEIVGESLAGVWEAWVIPQYVKDANPGLVSVSDLPDYIEVFTTSDSGGKARFVNCIPGWACTQVNNAKFDAYGLGDALTVISPGSGAALLDDLEGAYSLGEAWLGYMWSPTVTAGRLDLYVLEEPEWSQECWDGDKGCAYPPYDIRVVINSTLADRAPELVEFLRAWDFDAATDSKVEAWMADNDADPDAGALHYLRNYRNAWSTFVPADVAEKVDAALGALG